MDFGRQTGRFDRGAQEDWLASAEIWTYLVLTLSATWMVVIHFVSATAPMFDRALFADRNFIISLGFMIVIGVVMFAVMALLPPMLQNLFGYGVIDTGIVLMPRGVGILISMQVSGLMMRRGIDARPVVASGFLICAFSLWQMAHWSLDVDEAHVIISGLLQGLGMGLVFIPLQVSAFATLSPALRTDGSSLLNLFRSLGASAGISLMSVLLARNIQTAHADLAAGAPSAAAGAARPSRRGAGALRARRAGTGHRAGRVRRWHEPELQRHQPGPPDRPGAHRPVPA